MVVFNPLITIVMGHIGGMTLLGVGLQRVITIINHNIMSIRVR